MRSLKNLNDCQLQAFKKLAQDKWSADDDSGSLISPKWFTRAKVDELKAILFGGQEKSQKFASGNSKKSTSEKVAKTVSGFDKRALKLKSSLNEYSGGGDFISFLMNFLVKEYFEESGDKLLGKVKKKLATSIKAYQAEIKIAKGEK